MAEQVNTPSELIDKLGGNSKVAPLVGLKPNAVGNWRVNGIPPRHYPRLLRALNEHGLTASYAIFGMRE
jgi:hypothetical protein